MSLFATVPSPTGAAGEPTAVDRIARTVNRLTFGRPAADRYRWADSTPEAIVDELLAEQPTVVDVPDLGDDPDWQAATEWWLDVLRRPDTGIHERMVWFWHGHLTSSIDKADPRKMLVQHGVLRRHALGNFRTLLHEISVDAAMLQWLDGDGSEASSPNENHARELMELFALGHGNFTEDDVRAAATAMAGHWVDEERGVVFEPDRALRGSVSLFGTRVRRTADVVDAVCDHPACARHIASTVHEYLVGAAPSASRLDELADVFAAADLDIGALVAAVVRHETFTGSDALRPRSPLEWFLAVERLIGGRLDIWLLDDLGQFPMAPPNVAGWPDPLHWVSADAVITKAAVALDHSWDTATLDEDDAVGDVLGRAGLAHVSSTTRSVLDDAARSVEGRRERSSLLHAAVIASPEFSLT